MSSIHPTPRPIIVSLLCGLLLGLTGCVSSLNSPMPAGWPAVHALARVSELDGLYRGDHTEVARFNQVFFPKQLMSIQGLDAYRLTTQPAGLQVEALAGGTVLATRVIPVELEAGAVIFEHKDSDAQGSYRARATAQVNELGELVVAYHRASTSFLGGSTTDWMRLPRAPQ